MSRRKTAALGNERARMKQAYRDDAAIARIARADAKPERCSNCSDPITTAEKASNKGYCNECAFEAVGEGEV